MQVAFYDDVPRFTTMVNKIADELEARVAAGEGVAPADAPRILVTGTPMAIPNWKLHDVIEKAGARGGHEEMCTGSRYYSKLVDETPTDLAGHDRRPRRQVPGHQLRLLHPQLGQDGRRDPPGPGVQGGRHRPVRPAVLRPLPDRGDVGGRARRRRPASRCCASTPTTPRETSASSPPGWRPSWR